MVLRIVTRSCAYGAVVALSACGGKAATVAPPAPVAVEATALEGTPESPIAAEVVRVMDRNADPCQDFFRYACGGWLDSTEIPSDQSRWGRFNELAENNREALRGILERSKGSADPALAKAGDVYAACMDESGIEAKGAAPLEPMLAQIENVKDAKSLITTVAQLHTQGAHPLFFMGVEADYKNPEVNIAQVFQGGLGLPDRDYYLKDDEQSKTLRAAYERTVAELLTLSGTEAEVAKEDAVKVIAFETKLAQASMRRDELRNPEKHYNKIDLKGLKKLAPQIPWDAYLKTIGHADIKDINVAPTSYFSELGKLVKSSDKDTLKAYLRWHLVRGSADHLSKPFVDTSFAFYGKMLRGQQELQPRWKRCVQYSDRAVGELVGQAFVEQKFAGDSKRIALDMIKGIESAFAAALPKLAWMDDTTRERAAAKMQQVVNKIGYPDKWREYDALAISPTDHHANFVNASRFDFNREASKVGQPVDKAEWHMTPPTVNAYYNPTANEMVFPAGILQPPFFSAEFPMAMSFGGIGMVMGHELTHGFDDQGRKFDGNGKFVEWWDPSVSSKFDERTSCVDKLYSEYEVQPGVKLNGKLTLGENIADLGGIKQAYAAYGEWVKEHGAEQEIVPGLTNEQLLFVSFGQIWCSKETAEAERMLVVTDSHSRPRFRVNGPLSNFPGFWDAFSCEEGTAMHPQNACEVW